MERFTNAAFSFEVTDTAAAGRDGPEGVAIPLPGFPQDRCRLTNSCDLRSRPVRGLLLTHAEWDPHCYLGWRERGLDPPARHVDLLHPVDARGPPAISFQMS